MGKAKILTNFGRSRIRFLNVRGKLAGVKPPLLTSSKTLRYVIVKTFFRFSDIFLHSPIKDQQ